MLIVLACACLCVCVCAWLVVLSCAHLCLVVMLSHRASWSSSIIVLVCAGWFWVVLVFALFVLGCVHPPSACCAHLLCLNPFQVSNPHTANQASGCPKQLSIRCLAAASLHPSVPKSHPQTHTQADRSRFASLLTTNHPHRI